MTGGECERRKSGLSGKADRMGVAKRDKTRQELELLGKVAMKKQAVVNSPTYRNTLFVVTVIFKHLPRTRSLSARQRTSSLL